MKLSASMHPSVVLGAVLETLVRGRRVAVLGDATLGLAERLSPRGARLVHAYDPDPARTAEAIARAGASGPGPKPVAFAVLEGDLGVRDGAFDVVVVPDLSAFPDASEVLRRARRLLPTTGVLVAATPNPSVSRRLLGGGAPSPTRLDYYQLYDAVTLQFPVVRMLGQAPFVGYSVVDFAPDGEVEVAVDTSLCESTEEPEWFVAVAGERPARLDPFTVVELPFEDVALDGGAEPDEAPASSVVALTEAQTRLAMLGTEIERMRERERAEAERAGKLETALGARVAELEADIADRSKRLRELEGRAGDAHVRAERLGHELRELDEELRRQRDRAARLTKQLDDEKRARTKAEVELGLARGAGEPPAKTTALASELDAARGRIAELEGELDQVATTRVVPPPMPDGVDSPRVPRAPDSAVLRELAASEDALDLGAPRASELAAERDEARALLADREAELTTARALLDDVTRLRTSTERELAGALAAREAAARRADELGKQLLAAEQRLADAEGARDAALARAGELEADLDALRDQIASLQANADELARRAAEPVEDEAAVEEIERLEDLLRERGQVVAQLQRDVREAERVGRELLAELEAARADLLAPPTAESPPTGAGEATVPAGLVLDLTARLDTLAQSAADTEADLVAARWRIAQLEREADHARTTTARAQEELERALREARDEIAALRAAREADVREQSVLLHQLAGAVADE